MSHFFILHDEQRRQRCIDTISMLPLKRPVSVEIKEYRKNRSTAQNRTMWMWLNTMAPDCGVEEDDLHEICKQRFLGLEERIVTISRNGVYLREMMVRPRSTASLSASEFSQYLNSLEALAKNMGIKLPYPDDYKYAIGE